MHRRLVWALVVAGTLAAGAAAGPAAAADVRWLCRPGLAKNPCSGDQTTRYYAPDGSSHVARPAVPPNPPVDCFYVYPTVSNQPTMNALRWAAPEVRSIAVFQAQRFSTRCRVFAPLYRQVTAVGLTLAGQTGDTSAYETAYADVLAAWREYLRRHNGGRGVILVGHSQGSRMLRALIRSEIDGRPGVHDLLVSAVIPGANANERDFDAVPQCVAQSQFGCVVSYSTFNETPPANSRYGRTDTDPVGGALGLPAGPGVRVLCTDPARLAGRSGPLRSLVPSRLYAPGVILLLMMKLYGGLPPSADTPWLAPKDHYTGRCTTSNGAHVLMIESVAGARRLSPSPDATWGTHLVDLNIALDDILDVVADQTAAWLGSLQKARSRN